MSHRGRRGIGAGRGRGAGGGAGGAGGIGGGTNQYAQRKADEIKAVSFQAALDTIERLEVKMTEFASRYQHEIQTDPVFRQRFLEMCAPLGVDPLASKKTVWGQMLGMGDFYHELAVKIAEVCFATRTKNGGIMSVKEIQSTLARRKTRLGMANASGGNVSSSDIAVAIKKLAKLGGGFRVVEVGQSTMVVSVPTELDNDHMSVMAVASTIQTDASGITLYDIRDATGWTRERVQRALELLTQEGMAWLDTYQGQDYYWFPSIWQEQKEDSKLST